MSLVSRLALEVWRASGERTLKRLDDLVDHFGRVYAYNIDTVEAMRKEARDGVRAWEVNA